MLGPVFFLSGDAYPGDLDVDIQLQARLASSCVRWTGQKDIYDPSPGGFPLGDFPRRADHLETYLAERGPTSDIILIGRSSGGRLAAWYASRHPVRAVVCLGYPFRFPARRPEPERYAHLAGLKVPTLILQGLRDEYGGRNVLTDYALSPKVRVKLLDTDHGFGLVAEAWDGVARDIVEFCSGPALRSAERRAQCH